MNNKNINQIPIDILIGKNIKYYRHMIGISQNKLADIVDSDRTYISGIENGKYRPSLYMVEAIADALDIEVYKLFKEDTYYKSLELPDNVATYLISQSRDRM